MSGSATHTAPVPPAPRAQAIAADPRNPLAKFERAAVLMAEDRWRDALAELHALKVGAGGWGRGLGTVGTAARACGGRRPRHPRTGRGVCVLFHPPPPASLLNPRARPPPQDLAPREASVLFHMGKIYKKLDMLDEAMACFAHALDLQPPSADTNLIKWVAHGRGAVCSMAGGRWQHGGAGQHSRGARGRGMRAPRASLRWWRAAWCRGAIEKLRTPDDNEEEEI